MTVTSLPTRTVPLSAAELLEAATGYLEAVIAGAPITIDNVATADPGEIGWEVVETFEHDHGPLATIEDDDTHDAIAAALHALGPAVVALAAAARKAGR